MKENQNRNVGKNYKWFHWQLKLFCSNNNNNCFVVKIGTMYSILVKDVLKTLAFFLLILRIEKLYQCQYMYILYLNVSKGSKIKVNKNRMFRQFYYSLAVTIK